MGDDGEVTVEAKFYGCHSNLALWKAVQGVGALVDAYVPRKMEKGGTIFGFVRFVKVKDQFGLLRSINDMVFEGRRLKANIAKYGRNSGAGSKEIGRDTYGRQCNGMQGSQGTLREGNRHANIINRGRSFKDMLVGGSNGAKEEGRKGNGMVNWCAWLKKWDESFRLSSRIVCLRIYGVPINCWDPTIFTCIANKYGRILLPFDCSVEAINFSFGRICILTANLDHIKAHSCCVEWRNINFKVRIEEDDEWYPNLLLVLSEFDSEDEDDMGLDDLRDKDSVEDL
ncbi:hypothetical protein LXL04_039352 [Taraxacum kok-saghyz]